MYNLNDRLRAARRMRGFPSAPIAARELALVVGTYANAENGRSIPMKKTMVSYAEALGISVEWLVDGEPVTDSDKAAIEFLPFSRRRLKVLSDDGVRRAASALKRARVLRGFGSAAAAASHFGWSVSALRCHESGRGPIPHRTASIYSFALSIPAEMLDASSIDHFVDWADLARGKLRSRAAVTDFCTRIAATDYARKPPIDWLPIYDFADLLQWAEPDGDDYVTTTAKALFPVVSTFTESAFGVPALDVALVDMDETGDGRRTLFIHVGADQDAKRHRWITVRADKKRVEATEELKPVPTRAKRRHAGSRALARSFAILGEFTVSGAADAEIHS